jgi:pre-mRNA 3'-end-processing factor FIP1
LTIFDFVANAVNQTTEYNPSLRPGSTAANPTDGLSATQINGLTNSTIPPSGDAGTAPNVATDAPTNGVVAPGALPPSSLPVVTVPPGQYRFDPMNPSGIIPSTGNSVYEIDIAQFEGSGQPWRRPGSDLQDYFNFGFDEVSYPKFLRYKQEMEMGRNALVR